MSFRKTVQLLPDIIFEFIQRIDWINSDESDIELNENDDETSIAINFLYSMQKLLKQNAWQPDGARIEKVERYLLLSRIAYQAQEAGI